MKIKSIAAICRSKKTVYLFSDYANAVQWISDGTAAYPLYGMPELDEETVLTIMDVPEKERGKWLVNMFALPEKYDFKDVANGERLTPGVGVSIGYGGGVYAPVRTSQGLRLFDPGYLKPLADMQEVTELYERIDGSGEPYIAVKAGFMLVALITPCSFSTEDLADKLEMVCRELREAMDRRKLAKGEGEQLEIDEDTGEVLER